MLPLRTAETPRRVRGVLDKRRWSLLAAVHPGAATGSQCAWEGGQAHETPLPWKAANEESPVPEEQYQQRFWRRRLDGIGLDMVNKEFLAIEFKRTRDARSNYVERATAVAQEQYTSLLTGLQAVGQVKGWKVQQIVFVGGTCGSVHFESFNKNMKALGLLWARLGCGGSGWAPGWCGWALASLLRRCCGGAVCWRPAISLPTRSVAVGEVGRCVGVRWRAGGGVGVLRTGPVAAGVRVYSSVSHL
jgi:hypothetical protein